jgi:hypothetical protein
VNPEEKSQWQQSLWSSSLRERNLAVEAILDRVEALEAELAAAPDLLEACQAFVAWDADVHTTPDDASRMAAKVRAAVAKATKSPIT